MLDHPRPRGCASDQPRLVEKDCASVRNLDVASVGNRLEQAEERDFVGRKAR